MDSTFIGRHSILRSIWADPDVVLLIFAGSAAEFALNRAVDWLFFTNNLPQDPIGRLFSTVRYAQRIVFASESQAHTTLRSIASVHAAIEQRRGRQIPQWAYRDVLYMLIDYSRRSYELLHGRLSPAELEDLYAGFVRVGTGLQIPELPGSFGEWLEDRRLHLERDLAYSPFTKRLFERYRARLGPWRYQILLEIQGLLTPELVREQLRLTPRGLIAAPGVKIYSLIRHLRLEAPVQRVLIPRAYWNEFSKLKSAAACCA